MSRLLIRKYRAAASGDLPGIGMVIIDGMVSAQRSRNTPPATMVPEIASSMQTR